MSISFPIRKNFLVVQQNLNSSIWVILSPIVTLQSSRTSVNLNVSNFILSLDFFIIVHKTNGAFIYLFIYLMHLFYYNIL